MKDCSKKLVVLAKNNAKQRMYSSLKKVAEIKSYLKNILSKEHCVPIKMWQITLEKIEFLKKKKQRIEKYNSLLDKYCQHSNYKANLIKPAILNLTKEEIPNHYESLLNLGPKFVPTNKKLPFMDIITSTESCALNHRENEAETLRQNVSNILQKNLNLKIKSNLQKRWKKSIKKMTKNDKIRLHELDTGCGFAIVTNDTAIEKIEE